MTTDAKLTTIKCRVERPFCHAGGWARVTWTDLVGRERESASPDQSRVELACSTAREVRGGCDDLTPRFGRDVFDLLAGDLSGEIYSWITEVLERGDAVRILLDVNGFPEAHSFPWEVVATHASLPGDSESTGNFLLMNGRVCLSRLAKPGNPSRKLESDDFRPYVLRSKLRVLIVEGDREGIDDEAYGTTIHVMREALRDLDPGGLVEIVGPTCPRNESELASAFESDDFHVVVFIGHSRNEKLTKGRHLDSLADSVCMKGWSEPLSAERLATYLASRNTVRLVVLAACEIGEKFAIELGEKTQVEHVIGMGADVDAGQLRAYLLKFFRALAPAGLRAEQSVAGRTISAACQWSRSRMSLLDYWLPVHWTMTEADSPFLLLSELELGLYCEEILTSAEFAMRDLIGRPKGRDPHYIPLQVGERIERSNTEERQRDDRLGERLDSTIGDWHSHSEPVRSSRLSRIPVIRLVQSRGPWFLQGDAGAGKSTLMLALARDEAKRTGRVALIVNLSSWAASGKRFLEYWAERRLEKRNDRQCDRHDDRTIRELVEIAQEWLEHQFAYVVLDGLDEVAREHAGPALRDRLDDLAQKDVPVVVTSRYGGFGTLLNLASFQMLELIPLDLSQSRAYLTHHLGEGRGIALHQELSRHSQMRSLVGNPFFLELVAFVYEREKFTLPAGLPEVFEVAVQLLISMDPPRDQMSTLDELGVDEDDVRRLVEHVAWHAFLENSVRDIPRRILLRLVKGATSALGLPTAAEDIIRFFAAHRLLNERGETYHFLHLSLQEFLAACHLTDPDNGLDWRGYVHRKCWRAEWELVLQFVAGRLRNPSDLQAFVDTLLEPKNLPGGFRDDFHARRAVIASLGLAMARRFEGMWEEAAQRVDRRLFDMLCRGNAERLLRIVQSTKGLYRILPQLSSGTASNVTAALIQALEDPHDRQVRATVVEAFAGTQVRDAIDALIKAFNQPEDVPYKEAEALFATGDPDVIETLIQVVRDSNADCGLREAAMSVFERPTKDFRVIEALLHAMRDPDPNISDSAAFALSRTEDRYAIGVLIRELEDAEGEMLHAAAKALSGTKDRRAINALIRLLNDTNTNETLRMEAIEAIPGTDDRAAIEALIATLESPKVWVRATAAMVLSGNGDRAAIDGLVRVLNDPDEQVRETAANSLHGTTDRGAISALIQVLKSSDELEPNSPRYDFLIDRRGEPRDRGVRAAAARALSGTEDREAILALVQALGDTDKWLRRAAARALSGTKDREAVDALIPALGDTDEWVRNAAARALSGTNDRGAVEALVQALSDSDERVQCSAARALSGTHNRGATKALIHAVNDPAVTWKVRKDAALALSGTHDRGAIGALIRALNDPAMKWQVRVAAAGALSAAQDRHATDALSQVLSGNGLAVPGAQDQEAVEAFIWEKIAPPMRLRCAAATALSGTQDRGAIKALLQALADSDVQLREHVANALRASATSHESWRWLVSGEPGVPLNLDDAIEALVVPVWPADFVIWPDGTTTLKNDLDPEGR